MPISQNELNDYRRFAMSVSQEAAQYMLSQHGQMQTLEWKIRTNFKTKVDDELDAMIREKITERFPSHSIYSEENKDKEGSEFCWVVDPLDGTIPFTYSGVIDHFSVCISLAYQKLPIVGVINAAKRRELYVAAEGAGAFCNGQRLRGYHGDDIHSAWVGFAEGKESPERKRGAIFDYLKKLSGPEGILSPFSGGCASVPLALVASGKMQGYIALNLEPWDMAAAVVINKGAGNIVTTIDGREWSVGEPSILTANPSLHSKLLQKLHG